MDIASRDESTGAELARLRDSQSALEARLAALEPQPEPPKVDQKAARALKAAREKQLADLKARFSERQQLLTRLDELVADLVEFATAERVLRHDIIATHGMMVEKELRRELKNDGAIVDAIARRLRETVQPSTDLRQPALATHGEQLAARVIHLIGTPTDDLSDLM